MKTEEQKRALHESIRDKILEEWKKGNVCFRTTDGIMMQPIGWFIQQPIEGMLYDMNRDEATILTLLDEKWVNDLCLTKLLKYYHERCEELEKKLAELNR